MTRSERVKLWAGVGTFSLAVGVLSIVLLIVTHQPGNRVANAIFVPLIGWAFVATGLVAWSRRPDNETGRLIVFVGLAWFVSTWSSANGRALYTVGEVLGAVFLAAFAHLLVAYPSGRLQAGLERRVVVACYGLALGANLGLLLVAPHPTCMGGRCPTNLLFVGRNASVRHVVLLTTDVSAAVLLSAVALVLVRHWRAATPAARLGLRWILPAGVAALVLTSASFAADPLSQSASDIFQTLGLLVFAALPFFFLADLLRTRLARGGVAELLIAMRDTSSVAEAEDGLRRALRDPDVRLGVWIADSSCYLDSNGRSFAVPSDGSTRVTTMISSEEGGRLAAIVHDAALLQEPELLTGVVAATRLALDRDRLQTELRANLLQLERERDFVRDVVQAAPAFFCVLDLKGSIVRFNDAVVRATGLVDDESIRGRLLPDVLVAERDRAVVAGLIAATDPGPHEHRWIGRDGSELVVEWSLTPITDAQGEPSLLLTGLDVSERARHEDELRKSRMRLVEAGDAERRRLERNLHDGAQQRLVALSLAIRLAQSKLASEPVRADAILSEAAAELALALQELRELARGIHPAMLTDRGLHAALESLAEASPVATEIDADPGERLAEAVEAAAFYVASEALANVAKYAHAKHVIVSVRRAGDRVAISIADDGIGGADPTRGTGLRGLEDRVEALGGTLEVTSLAGKGTTVRAELPLTIREPAVVEATARS